MKTELSETYLRRIVEAKAQIDDAVVRLVANEQARARNAFDDALADGAAYITSIDAGKVDGPGEADS